MFKPYYEKREKIVEGTAEINVDEIKDLLPKVGITDTNLPNSEKGIPNFWLTSLKNSSYFKPMITAKDEKILKELKDITVEFLENGSFKLNFIFNTNNYFPHTVLTRTFTMDPVKQAINKITSTKIEWTNDDVNPTVEKKKKNIKNSKIFLFK
jgi:nucleosome assembly protein 1-like 1